MKTSYAASSRVVESDRISSLSAEYWKLLKNTENTKKHEKYWKVPKILKNTEKYWKVLKILKNTEKFQQKKVKYWKKHHHWLLKVTGVPHYLPNSEKTDKYRKILKNTKKSTEHSIITGCWKWQAFLFICRIFWPPGRCKRPRLQVSAALTSSSSSSSSSSPSHILELIVGLNTIWFGTFVGCLNVSLHASSAQLRNCNTQESEDKT